MTFEEKVTPHVIVRSNLKNELRVSGAMTFEEKVTPRVLVRGHSIELRNHKGEWREKKEPVLDSAKANLWLS